MTRRLISYALLVTLAVAGTALAQTNPGSAVPSRYLPPAGGQVQSRPAQPRPAQPYTGPQPIRQVGGQEPIRQPMGPLNAVVPAAPAGPLAPEWFPLAPAQQQWVDQILAFWEQESSQVKTFECKFQRWEYDPVFGSKTDAKTYAEGVIKYAQPDKGLYRVEKLSSYSPPAKPGDKPQYIEQDATFGEHWVCDGKQVFTLNARNKQMVVTPLPPEMQGKAIVDGPLPFLFGAKAETIKARYWIRVLPETGNGKFWLEAVPKGRQDAQNFKMIHIVIDEQRFLPEMLQLFAPNYDPTTNPSRTTHVFKDVKTADANAIQAAFVKGVNHLNIFHREFYEPGLPSGWKKVVESDVAVSTPVPQEAKGPADVPKRTFLPLPR